MTLSSVRTQGKKLKFISVIEVSNMEPFSVINHWMVQGLAGDDANNLQTVRPLFADFCGKIWVIEFNIWIYGQLGPVSDSPEMAPDRSGIACDHSHSYGNWWCAIMPAAGWRVHSRWCIICMLARGSPLSVCDLLMDCSCDVRAYVGTAPPHPPSPYTGMDRQPNQS